MEIFEYRGVRNLVCAEVTKDDTDAIEFGTPFQLMGVGEIGRTTEASSETHYYDNVPAIVIDSTGADTVTITGSAIPFKELATVTGQEYDEDHGMFVEGERKAKYFAIGYITEKTDGTEIFVWRYKGKFSIPESNHKTKDNGTEANGQSIVFTGINTVHKFNETGKSAKAINVDTSVNKTVKEATFFATVQTPDDVATP